MLSEKEDMTGKSGQEFAANLRKKGICTEEAINEADDPMMKESGISTYLLKRLRAELEKGTQASRHLVVDTKVSNTNLSKPTEFDEFEDHEDLLEEFMQWAIDAFA